MERRTEDGDPLLKIIINYYKFVVNESILVVRIRKT